MHQRAESRNVTVGSNRLAHTGLPGPGAEAGSHLYLEVSSILSVQGQ